MIQNRYATTKLISWPDVNNLQGCNLGAAMCCFVSNRNSNKSTPINNSDMYHMYFHNAQESGNVRDGYPIYGNELEGGFNCHGFLWSEYEGHAEIIFKENIIFHVAMKYELYDT